MSTVNGPESPAPSRPAEALLEQKEWLRVTLATIGDAVITADASGRVTFLNSLAESLTGWKADEAAGVPLVEVFKIVNETSRCPIEGPAVRALREGLDVNFANQTLLFGRDGTEWLVEDSAAPVLKPDGTIAGVVLVFRDITERRRRERAMKQALDFDEGIVTTLREPFFIHDERQEGDEMVMNLQDTGVRLARELILRIFDEFTPADRSLDRSQCGLGIGLALVQRLEEMHRDTVSAHSAGLGRGAEFTRRLPILHSQPRPPDSNLTKIAEPSVKGSRILVVDDNEISTDMLAKLLERLGYAVRTAFTGPAALEVAADFLPEVVLLDIELPGINGYEVARRLRQIPHLDRIKLVAMTGYGQQSDIRLAQEAGFDSHQVKPINFAKVSELLTTMLSGPSTAG